MFPKSPSRGTAARNAGWPILLLLVTVLSACGDSPTDVPPRDLDLRMKILSSAFSGNPASPVTFQVVVWNAGGGEISYYQDCCHDPILLQFTNAAGTDVYAERPVFCRCPTVPYPLGPSPLIQSIRFDGNVWESGELTTAPGGRYAVVAVFHYRIEPDGPIETLTRTVPFEWQADQEARETGSPFRP